MLSPVMIRFPQSMLDDVDAIRSARRDMPDRSSVIRELLAEALDARAKSKRG
jgi:metal-responsive CopG/Arc/MetJ family transcriptional regulator